MFGYIMINKPELKLREYEEYHSYYCGLCQALGRRAGGAGKLTLSFDMTFLYLLLSGLYEPEEKVSRKFCSLHPAGKQVVTTSGYADYAADMNILLSYYNLMDNWIDDRDLKSYTAAKSLKKAVAQIRSKYPRQAKAVADYVANLGQMESAPESSTSLDGAAGLTGTMLGEIFTPLEDEWAPSLRRLGFYLGKFIYLMDAFEDREKDEKKGSYNVWLLQDHKVTTDEAGEILNMMMSECSFAFEALPILKNAEILRNIIYSGAWVKFENIRQNEAKRAEEKDKEDNKC